MNEWIIFVYVVCLPAYSLHFGIYSIILSLEVDLFDFQFSFISLLPRMPRRFFWTALSPAVSV